MTRTKINWLACCAALLLPMAANADLIGVSNGAVGTLLYEGLGDDGTGRGTGIYTPGTCMYDAGSNETRCSLTGGYTETAASTSNPGSTGTFLFEMIYAGSAESPAIAGSQDPGGDILQLLALNGAFFELTITPDNGPPVMGLFPATPFEESIGFSIFIANPICTGIAPQFCTIGDVGLTPGATITGDVTTQAPFAFSIPSALLPPASVPEPGTLALLSIGLIGLAASRRRKKA